MNNDTQQTQPAVQIPDEIRTFLSSVIDDAQLVTTDKRVREQMIQNLFVELDRFILTRIAKALPKGKLEEFLKVDKTPSSEKMTAYLKENLPNAQQVFQDAFADFRDIYLEGIDTSRLKQAEEKRQMEE